MAKRRKVQPWWWERGFLSHHFWNKKGKVGSVLLCHGPSGERLYRWTCLAANANGHSSDLNQAKCAVEQAYAMGWVQVDLDGVQTIDAALQDFAIKQGATGCEEEHPLVPAMARSKRHVPVVEDDEASMMSVWSQADLFGGHQALV